MLHGFSGHLISETYLETLLTTAARKGGSGGPGGNDQTY
jgi:hypothetical protein